MPGLLRVSRRVATFAQRSNSLLTPRSLCARPLSTRKTLDTPFISDTIPLAEGILGTVEELMVDVGQSVVRGPPSNSQRRSALRSRSLR